MSGRCVYLGVSHASHPRANISENVRQKQRGPKDRERDGDLGEGVASPSPQSKRSGERCKLPSGVWGGAPAEIEFGAI